MSRPRKRRRICSVPDKKYINMCGGSGAVDMTVDEYEALRLIDYVGLTQQECARQMDVARSTITSIYENARYKLTDSLVNGKNIEISGGDYEVCSGRGHCCGQCGKNRCGRCKHGSCDRCIGIFHERGKECFVVQYN